MVACKSNDTKLKQQIIGTWIRPKGEFPIAVDGSFVSWEPMPPGRMSLLKDGSFSSFWGTTNDGYDFYRGTWEIKDGMLVMIDMINDGVTITNGLPSKSKIVGVDKDHLIYETRSGKGLRITSYR